MPEIYQGKKFQDIYRGHIVDYNPDNADGKIHVLKDDECVHTTHSYDDALKWVDRKRKEELNAKS